MSEVDDIKEEQFLQFANDKKKNNTSGTLYVPQTQRTMRSIILGSARRITNDQYFLEDCSKYSSTLR